VPYPNKRGEMEHYPVGDGDHDVTVSTGPSYQSQREAVGEFLDTLIQNLPNLPIPAQAAAKLLALAIQMKELDPEGDQMAEIISPSDGDQAQQLQGMQAQLQQQQAAMAEMQGQFQRLLVEKQGKVIDNEYALKLKEMDIQAKLAVAEIETKAQNLSERLAFVEEFMKQQHAQAHEAGMQAMDQNHERALARSSRTLIRCRKQSTKHTEVWISGDPVYCPDPVLVDIHGSTWGGSMIRERFISRGMHLEFDRLDFWRITTSRILDVQEKN